MEAHPHHPEIHAAGMHYDGHRYRVQGFLAGKVYGNPFSIDVAFGEPMNAAPDVIRGRADLGFLGLEAPKLRVYPRSVHLAEKLHAYTVPGQKLNSRVKDLPDIAILATLGTFDCKALREALDRTFEHRATHAVPAHVPDPPQAWRAAYERMALLDALPWKSVEAVHSAASAFLNPVLQGQLGVWNSETWAWTPTPKSDPPR